MAALKPKIGDLQIERSLDDTRQADICNAEGVNRLADFDHDRDYVRFGGFFGPYGPCVFLAAPDLLSAARGLLAEIEMLQAPEFGRAVAALRAACMKAEGRL